MGIYKIRVDKRYSAKATYSWLRKCGLSRRKAWDRVLAMYGWAPVLAMIARGRR